MAHLPLPTIVGWSNPVKRDIFHHWLSRPPVLQMELSLNAPFLRGNWTQTNSKKMDM